MPRRRSSFQKVLLRHFLSFLFSFFTSCSCSHPSVHTHTLALLFKNADKNAHIKAAFNFTPYEKPIEAASSTVGNPMDSIFALPSSSSSSSLPSSSFSTSLGGHSTLGASSATLSPEAPAAGGESPRLAGRKIPQEKPLTSELQVTSRRWGKGGDIAKKAAPASFGAPTSEPSKGAVAENAKAFVGNGHAAGGNSGDDAHSASASEHTSSSSSYRPRDAPAVVEDPRKKQLADSLFATEESAGPARASRVSRARKSGNAPARTARTATRLADVHPVSPQLRRHGGAGLIPDLMDADESFSGLNQSSSTDTMMNDFIGLELGDGVPAMPPPSYSDSVHHGGGGGGGGGGDLLGDHLLDPLGGLGSSSPARTQQHQHQQQPYSTTATITHASPRAAPNTAAATASLHSAPRQEVNLLGDVFGGPPLSSASAPSLVPQAAPPGFGGVDLLGSLSSSSSSAGSSASSGRNSSDVPAHLKVHPHETFGEVTSDPGLGVYYAKVWRPEAMDLVIFFRNKLPRDLPGVVTRLENPAGAARTDALGTTLSETVPAGTTRCHVISFVSQLPVAGMTLTGHTTYSDMSQAKNVYFRITLNAGDFVRPHPITTDVFGSLWVSTPCERTQRITGGVGSVDGFIDRISKQIHTHTVQIIGSEVIICGKVLTNSQLLCLLHGKISGMNTIDLIVRTSSMPFTEAVMRHCAAALK